MLAPWKLAVMTGVGVGIACALAQRDLGALHAISGSALVAGVISLITWFGLWVSRRPSLTFIPALGVACASAAIAFVFSLPIETHAVLVDAPAVSADRPFSMRDAHLISLVVLVLPGLIAFAVARAFGVPPNTALERTREE